MSTATKRLPLIDLPVAQERHLGCLRVEQSGKKFELPLGAVDISAKVADRVASVTVKQTFRNTYPEHLEAVYIFPLAGGSVVSDFEMRVGDRVVNGVVKERGQARVDYVAAIKEGKRAALLEQERDDVFTMQVGNIPPNEEITVVLTYSERLPFFESGKTELRLPLVVAPRYITGTPTQSNNTGLGTAVDTDVVPDASRITPPRLAPGLDPNVALNLCVELASTDSSGTSGILDLTCSQHAMQTTTSDDAVTVQLAREGERLNRDFVLQWRLAADDVRSSLLVYRDADQSYGMISITPPKRDDYVAAPRDVVFVLDRSGSMGVHKMISAARSCALLLSTLGPNDRFAIQAFDNVVEWLALPGTMSAWQSRWVNADEAGLERGMKFLRSIDSRGGTEMSMALNEAFDGLRNRSSDDGRIPILVVLTDGEVGDEAQIMKLVQQQISEARLFVVGIDTAVNTGLLRRLANLGGGTSTFVTPGARLEQALQSIGREIGTPVITDLEIVSDNGAVEAGSRSPKLIPDLFEGRAVTAYVKVTGKGAVRVKGRWADGKVFDQKVKQTNVSVPAIAQLWAKAAVTDMEDEYRLNPFPQLRQQMIGLACKHSILTKLTAFVAVDHADITNKTGDLRQIVQPVEEPDGWAEGQSLSRLSSSSMGWGAAAPTAGSIGSIGGDAGWGSAPTSQSLPAREAASLMGRLNQMPPGNPPPEPRSRAQGDVDALSKSKAEATKPDAGAAPNAVPPAPPPPPPTAPARSASPAQNSPAVPPNAPAAPPNATPPRIFQPVKDALGKLFNAADRTSLSEPVNGSSKASSQLLALFETFCKKLEEMYAGLSSGNTPSNTQLQEFEQTRKALLDALGHEACGMNVPLLQKFLRGAAVELIACLKQANGTAAGAKRIWDRHMQAFQDARAEATTSLSGTSSESRFWEATL